MSQWPLSTIGYIVQWIAQLCSSNSGSSHEYNTYNIDLSPENLARTSPKRTPDKEKIHNRRQGLKLILDYYHKNKKFISGVDEDWLRHLHNLIPWQNNKILMLTDILPILYVHSLKPSSQAYRQHQQA